MSVETRQYGDLSTQLVLESRRSTATDTLLKYNDSLVRSIIREQRDLERAAAPLLLQAAAAAEDDEDNAQPPPPALMILQTAILRNKRCLLAYHHHRTARLRDMYWTVGGALPHLLSDADTRSRLSPHEADYLRQYHDSVMEYRADLGTSELDIMAGIEKPVNDLNVLVKVKKECGVIETELGTIDFRKGQRFMVRRADIEHLIVQGYLEELG
ncbi:hypothetical protein HGRIS_014396 [Hohenbuehelia grisea]|uniref:DNA replication complex GINS protein PSF1 n=1 Tax=Hohenbuehelia grisea TaxID=104357 RepID=A0ABR3JVF0_9AGAR